MHSPSQAQIAAAERIISGFALTEIEIDGIWRLPHAQLMQLVAAQSVLLAATRFGYRLPPRCFLPEVGDEVLVGFRR